MVEDKARKGDEILGPPEKGPFSSDVEFALRKTKLGGYLEIATAIHQLLVQFREHKTGSFDELLFSMLVLSITEKAPSVYRAVARGRVMYDSENFDANLEAKPRKNYIPGNLCRNAAEFIRAIEEEADVEVRAIGLPKHLWSKIEQKKKFLHPRLAGDPQALDLVIDAAIRLTLNDSADGPSE